MSLSETKILKLKSVQFFSNVFPCLKIGSDNWNRIPNHQTPHDKRINGTGEYKKPFYVSINMLKFYTIVSMLNSWF